MGEPSSSRCSNQLKELKLILTAITFFTDVRLNVSNIVEVFMQITCTVTHACGWVYFGFVISS